MPEDHCQYCEECGAEVPNMEDHGALLYWSEPTSGLDHKQLCPDCAEKYIGGQYALPGTDDYQEYRP